MSPVAAAPARPEAALGDLLDSGETILLAVRPSPLFIPLGPLVSILWIAALTLLLAWLDRRFGWIPGDDDHVLALGTLAASVRLGWQAAEWWGRLYVLTDRRVLRRGAARRDALREIPLADLAMPTVFRATPERFVGAGTVVLADRAGRGFAWDWIGRPDEVRRLVAEARDRYGRR